MGCGNGMDGMDGLVFWWRLAYLLCRLAFGWLTLGCLSFTFTYGVLVSVKGNPSNPIIRSYKISYEYKCKIVV